MGTTQARSSDRSSAAWGLLVLPVALLVVTVVAVVVISKWGSDDGRSRRAAVIFPGSVRFFDVQLDAMRDRAADHNIELVAIHGDWNPQTQLDLIESAAGGDFDVLAVAAADTSVVAEAVELVSLDVPLLTFTNAIGTDPTGSFEGTSGYVGRNEQEAGRLLAEQVVALGLDAPTVLLIEGAPGTAPQTQRSAGYLERVEQMPNWPDPIRVPIENWDLTVLETQLSVALADGDVDVVAAQWADAAVVASRFVEATGESPQIVALEWTAGLVAELDQGHIVSSTYFSLVDEAVAVIDAVDALIEDPASPVFTVIDQSIIAAEEADAVVPDW